MRINAMQDQTDNLYNFIELLIDGKIIITPIWSWNSDTLEPVEINLDTFLDSLNDDVGILKEDVEFFKRRSIELEDLVEMWRQKYEDAQNEVYDYEDGINDEFFTAKKQI